MLAIFFIATCITGYFAVGFCVGYTVVYFGTLYKWKIMLDIDGHDEHDPELVLGIFVFLWPLAVPIYLVYLCLGRLFNAGSRLVEKAKTKRDASS